MRISPTATSDFCEPRQQRGRDTVERIVSATERLLRVKPFDKLSIQEICAAAKSNSGSFYARFKSKDALLPYIYARYDHQLSLKISSLIEDVEWQAFSFEEAISRFVDISVSIPGETPWLFRATALFARNHPNKVPAKARSRSADTYKLARIALSPHADRIKHDDPMQAIDFAAFCTISVARERFLFPNAPLSEALEFKDVAFINQLKRQMKSYLNTESR
jgi:AcrR family transcriptional regulator